MYDVIIVEKVSLFISDTCRDTDTLGSSHSSNKDRIGMVGVGPSLPLHSLTITLLLYSSSRCQSVMGAENQEFWDLIFFEPVWLPSLFLLQMTGC